ncbi:MAG: hypothetical protein C4530_14540 [Desulfobacteraceae bacterium]|nr:MAG: hypothetical protein C4530_14540 [Desulfobacteraceae bacterium]
MEENRPTMGLLILFFILSLLLGCASEPVKKTPSKTVFDRIDEDFERIKINEGIWSHEYDDLQENLENWTAKYQLLKTNERKFIKSMPDKQLELYSNYLDSLNSGNPAKVEYNRRQLIASLDDNQKSYLISIYDEYSKLEQQHKEYTEKHNELLTRKTKIEADYARNLQWHNNVLTAISEYMGTGSYTYQPSFPAAMSRLQNTITRNQQRNAFFFQNFETNMSLRDIASAIRGF